MATVIIASIEIADPPGQIASYVNCHGGSLEQYDLAGRGDPDTLTIEEIERTRIIRSRISRSQCQWMFEQAQRNEELWRAVPSHALLADADPVERGGLYDDACALFESFLHPRQRGIWWGKVSKVLHLKRPGLFPILDRRLRNFYREPARAAAVRYQPARPGVRHAYWAAVRADATNPVNIVGLAELRHSLRTHPKALVRSSADLSDVRLLDILAWRAM